MFTEYVQDLCAAFRVLMQNSCWQDGAPVVFACGLVGKYFHMEKHSFLNLPPLASLIQSNAFAQHPPSMEGAAPCPLSPCAALSSPTLDRVDGHTQQSGRQDRTTGPCPIRGGPCCSRGSASSRPAGARALLGSALGRTVVGWTVPLRSPAVKLQAAGDVLDQPAW